MGKGKMVSRRGNTVWVKKLFLREGKEKRMIQHQKYHIP
jgi:hypothetical protein